MDIGTTVPDDVTIAGKNIQAGVLISYSGMPSFRQEGMPESRNCRRNYGTKEKPRIREYVVTTYSGKNIDEDADTEIYCPCCGKKLSDNGTQDFILNHLPFGETYTEIRVKRRRVRCTASGCHYHFTYGVPFKAEGHMITQLLLVYTQDLLEYGFTLKETSFITGLNKNVVKEIHKQMLEEKFTVDGKGEELIKPEKQAKYLAVDEFKLHDGYRYATVIIDLETGHILHLAHGKKKSAVYGFIDRVGEEWMSKVKAVACDMNSDFEEAFLERCPKIHIIYDHFHLVKNFNDKVVSEIRKDEQRRLKEEGRDEEAAELKRTKYILTSSRETLTRKEKEAAKGKVLSKASILFNKEEVKRKPGQQAIYQELIEKNELLLTCDLVKVALDDAYKKTTVTEMRKEMEKIINLCKSTNNDHFLWYASLIENHIEGIVWHARHPISTGKLEGINQMIKTERRKGYGYPDDEYFFLRLMEASRRKSKF